MVHVCGVSLHLFLLISINLKPFVAEHQAPPFTDMLSPFHPQVTPSVWYSGGVWLCPGLPHLATPLFCFSKLTVSVKVSPEKWTVCVIHIQPVKQRFNLKKFFFSICYLIWILTISECFLIDNHLDNIKECLKDSFTTRAMRSNIISKN